MSQPVVAIVVGLFVVGGVAASVVVYASRKGDASSSQFALWVILGVVAIAIGMFATSFLSGLYGGSSD